MKETTFIEQNQAKWKEFEEELNNKNKNPEKLSRLFIETTDDLSFSRTYYPNRSVRVYLNNVSQKTFQLIYKKKKSRHNNFKTFWTQQLPDTMWNNRKQLLWAFIIFVLGLLVAILSSIYYPEFATIMLGQGYIDQTIQNIDNGDPLGIYSSMEPLEMFLYIAANNIRVCFLVFLLGLFYGAGTVFILFRESIRVGAFLYFFFERGLFEDAFYTVMLHGTIELSMIVLAGMGGMVLAKGMVFPKTYSRFQSFVSSAREGVMIMIGVSLFLLLAAFIEGFATRHTEVSNIIRGGIIFLSFAIVVGYFVIYPYLRYRKGLVKKDNFQEHIRQRMENISLTKIKDNGQIFTDIFYYFNKNLVKHARQALLFGILLTLGILVVVGSNKMEDFLFGNSGYRGTPEMIFDIIWPWNEVSNFTSFLHFPLLVGVYLIPLAIIIGSSLFFFQKESNEDITFWKFLRSNVVTFLLSSLGILLSVFLDEWSLLTFIFIPFFIFVAVTSISENIHWGKAIGKTFKLLKGNWMQFIGAFFYSIAIPWIVLMALSSEIWHLIYMLLEVNVASESELSSILPFLVYSSFALFLLSFVLPVLIYGISLFYANVKEINGAFDLRSRIKNIGFKKRAYGLEKE